MHCRPHLDRTLHALEISHRKVEEFRGKADMNWKQGWFETGIGMLLGTSIVHVIIRNDIALVLSIFISLLISFYGALQVSEGSSDK